jgi:hypothetical protein
LGHEGVDGADGISAEDPSDAVKVLPMLRKHLGCDNDERRMHVAVEVSSRKLACARVIEAHAEIAEV